VITSSIDGVVVKELTVHADDRGYLLEVVRDDDRVFHEVKQTTFTVAYPGVIKAFHWHRRQWDIWFFASGMAQTVLHDLREGSPTCGRTDHTTERYDPDAPDEERIPFDDPRIGFDWRTKNR